MTTNTAYPEAAEIIARLRRRGWTVQDIARRLDCTGTAVYAWASGRQTPNLEHMEALRNITDVAPSVRTQRERERLIRLTSDRLRILVSRNWTVTLIGRRLGVHRRTLHKYLDGKVLPKQETRDEIARLLNEPSPRTPEETLLASMALGAGDDNIYKQGMAQLMEISGYGRSRVERLLKKMTEEGIITRLNNEPNEFARWRLNWRPSIKPSSVGRWEKAE